jgi:hypothetical protein
VKCELFENGVVSEGMIYSAYADIDGMGTEWVDGVLRGIGRADGDGSKRRSRDRVAGEVV